MPITVETAAQEGRPVFRTSPAALRRALMDTHGEIDELKARVEALERLVKAMSPAKGKASVG